MESNSKVRSVIFVQTLICFVISNACQRTQTCPSCNVFNKAFCQFIGPIVGFLDFVEENDIVRINGSIIGDKPFSTHGFHIHEFGDMRNLCDNTGGHFNPYNKNHGAPTSEDRHAGDLGNVVSDKSGKILIDIQDRIIKISGRDTIIGRAMVLHQNADDFVSQPSGNSGKRIACCVIGVNH